MKKLKLIFCFATTALICSCIGHYRKGSDLGYFDLAYLRKLGLISDKEKVLFFDTEVPFSGLKVSGNFITDKRIAAYWIDDNDPSKTSIHYAFYNDVADLKCRYIKALTYSSYITVTKTNGEIFKVYIDADSTTVHAFYNRAVAEWHKNPPQSSPKPPYIASVICSTSVITISGLPL